MNRYTAQLYVSGSAITIGADIIIYLLFGFEQWISQINSQSVI